MRRNWVAVLAIMGCIVACTPADKDPRAGISRTGSDPYLEARVDNLNRHVSQSFAATPRVIGGDENTGVAASQLFFDASDTVVIAADNVQDQLRAASIAVVSHAPMLTLIEGKRMSILEEIVRLGARYILTVGSVDIAASTGGMVVQHDPGNFAALGQMTAVQFHPHYITHAGNVVREVAHLDSDTPELLLPGWDPHMQEKILTNSYDDGHKKNKAAAFPAQSKRDAGIAPIVIADGQSSIAAIATARSYGADVRVMDYPDPRISRNNMKMVAGLYDQPLIALGDHFGTDAQLAEQIRLGEEIPTQILGGGSLVFPGRTMIALRVSDEDPYQITRELEAKISDYTHRSDNQLVPTVVVDNTADPAVLVKWAKTMAHVGGYVFAYIGAEQLVEETLNYYQEALNQENVGVIVDKRNPIELNAAINWLDHFVDERALPQKAVVLPAQQIDGLDLASLRLSFVMYSDLAAQSNHVRAQEIYATTFADAAIQTIHRAVALPSDQSVAHIVVDYVTQFLPHPVLYIYSR
ncbi:putative lipoprotein [Corynebacterium kutscheri]|uniref:Lipoprotein n=1 Tax=Corynebacterium kutscheri TaxID=35755 RepID=A0A0F6TDB8_9CORY|nr:hypothetical protein [Corynebacterium kutscheri]AKE41039.1 hypothetical protein UL82_04170 [Corynebacterium kutscheri]VEH06928.1 putative lipoprotein [Corynebacterium kutscheri]VEH09337.1 putative lipoprotein [Corynebacterium kutscheri]VEH79424.1 putative lipoprotein [Corynebacterium kutscheri]